MPEPGSSDNPPALIQDALAREKYRKWSQHDTQPQKHAWAPVTIRTMLSGRT